MTEQSHREELGRIEIHDGDAWVDITDDLIDADEQLARLAGIAALNRNRDA